MASPGSEQQWLYKNGLSSSGRRGDLGGGDKNALYSSVMTKHKRALAPQTLCRRWWRKLKRVSQHIIVIPDVKLVVPGVVVDGRDVLIRVGEGYLDRQLLPSAGVVGIDHHVATRATLRLPLVVLEDGAHGV